LDLVFQSVIAGIFLMIAIVAIPYIATRKLSDMDRWKAMRRVDQTRIKWFGKQPWFTGPS